MEMTMTPRETEPQKETIERVMHEYKHGELRSGTSAQKVKNRKQAVAIALSEAGASDQQTPKENEEHLRHTKAKERRGETAKDETEGKRPRRRPSAR
jgi:exonuclease VII small subunit